MTTLHELVDEFRRPRTDLQRDQHLKTLVGTEVEVVGDIQNISSQEIRLVNILPPLTLADVSVRYDGEELRQQLLRYSHGDSVRLLTRLRSIAFDERDTYKLSLVSIADLTAREQRDRKKQKRRKSSASVWEVVTGSIMITLIWLVIGSIVGAVAGYILKWKFGIPVFVTFGITVGLAGVWGACFGVFITRS